MPSNAVSDILCYIVCVCHCLGSQGPTTQQPKCALLIKEKKKNSLIVFSQGGITESIANKIIENITYFQKYDITFKLHPNEYHMKYKKLGVTDLEVSAICLGTMTFGEQNSQSESFEQMNYAVERGINFFDTAEMYPAVSKKFIPLSTA